MERSVHDIYIKSIQRLYEDIGSLKASIERLEKERKGENKKIYLYFPKVKC